VPREQSPAGPAASRLLHHNFVVASDTGCTITPAPAQRVPSTTRGPDDGSPTNLHAQRMIALAIALLGGLLMVAKIHADSEPGALPLALVLGGVAWLAITQWRLRNRHG
jgi:hypothetical protein